MSRSVAMDAASRTAPAPATCRAAHTWSTSSGSGSRRRFGRQKRLERVGRSRGATRARKPRRHALSARAHAGGLPHRLTQAAWIESERLDSRPRARRLHMTRYLELVAAERHHAYGNTDGERLLGDPHAAVADDAGRALEDRCVWHVALDARVRGNGYALEVVARRRRDHEHILAR